MDSVWWTRKRKVAGGAAVLVVASGGIAFAFWTASGTGTGAARTGEPLAVTVEQTSKNTGLAPGAATELAGTVANPNSSPVYVTSVTATVDPLFSAQADRNQAPCTAKDFVIAGTGKVDALVAADSPVSWSGLTLTMTNFDANQDNCKNVQVPILYSSS